MLSNLNIILIIVTLLIIVLVYIYINNLNYTKKEKFTVTNQQMQNALSSAKNNLDSSITNLESLQQKFQNLNITVTKLLKTQTSDIENLKKAISENLKIVKVTDDKLAGKIKTLSDILTGKYIVGEQQTTTN